MTLEMEIKSRCRDAMDAGRKEGIAEGEILGAEKTRLENARNLKALGVALETIVKATGLTLEQVQAL